MMKVCSKCGIEKEFTFFSFRNKAKKTYNSKCKSCIKEYRQENKINIAEYQKEYHKKNSTELKEKQQEYYNKNKEVISKNKKVFYTHNKNKISNDKKLYYIKNKTKKNEYNKKYYKCNTTIIKKRIKKYNNNNKIKRKRYMRIWMKENSQYMSVQKAKRRGLKLKCTPPWYEIQKEEITALYKKAQELTKRTGIIHHVDHIYPLKPRKKTDPVGLHVLANLQILTAKENLRKNNMQPEEWEKYKL